MTIAVKLVRLKSRAKKKGRPKYRYAVRWFGPDGWQQESCRTADRRTGDAIRKRKFAEVNGLIDPADDAEAEEALTWEDLESQTEAAMTSRGNRETTVETYCRTIRTFRNLAGLDAPGDVDPASIERFIAQRREGNKSPATVNKDLRQLRTVFNRAVRRGVLPENPFREFEKLAEDQPDVRTLTDDELRAVCGHFREQPLLQTFLLVSLQTGCRIGEVAYLRAEDLERASGWIAIRSKTLPDGRTWKPKTKTSVRDVWIPPWLMRRVGKLQLARKPFVWSRHVADIGRAFDGEFDPRRFVPFVQHQITAACDTLGIPRFSHHDLRRTQQTRLREKGWGDAVCLAIAGQNTGAAVLRTHYWRPNHRRMTRPAFDDVASIFLESKLVEGDPLGDTCQLRREFERSQVAASDVG